MKNTSTDNEQNETVLQYIDETEKLNATKSFPTIKKILTGFNLILAFVLIIEMIPTRFSAISYDDIVNLLIEGLVYLVIFGGMIYISHWALIGRIQNELKKGVKICIETEIRSLSLGKTMGGIQVTHPKYFHTKFILNYTPSEAFMVGEKTSLTFLPKSGVVLSLKKVNF